ncbi:hypothetical protein [Nocardioides caldifontis]|uniref:hypothetical protein n=1 Tax=Nocardioides caldifontis TaxID=2588938 RepID=UPI00193A6E81|nr:hypothetical protein [Nocardioides caldifontis]
MTTLAYVAVSPEGRTHRDQVYLREAALPGLRRLTDAVKPREPRWPRRSATPAPSPTAAPTASRRSRRRCHPDELVDRLVDAGRRGGASLFGNGTDPGFANDVLPLALTSLSQRIDEVRCSEIADYSTYHQPFVNAELFGFGKPVEEVPPLFAGGILTMAWGSVVRVIAVGLELTLDEPLGETVELAVAEADVETVDGVLPKGSRCGVRFEVVGCVDGVPRVVLEHVTRTHPSQRPDWPQPAGGAGCYRVEVKGEPSMTLDLAHHGEHGDHNVSGMIGTAVRLVNAVEAVVDAERGW